MSLILHLETSAAYCSVCISKGAEIIAVEETQITHSHAGTITLFIEACTKKAGIKLADLSAVAISMGPGSYTGLRVGASVAKGICYSLKKPLIAVDTLLALSVAAQKERPDAAFFVPMIDARRMEVYTATFDAQQKKIADTSAAILDQHSFSDLLQTGDQIIFCGDGATKAQTVIEASNADFQPIRSRAAYLVPLALDLFSQQKFVDIAYFSPFYFKAPNITTSKKNILG